MLTGNEGTRVYPQAYVQGDSWKMAITGVDFTSFLLLLDDLLPFKKTKKERKKTSYVSIQARRMYLLYRMEN